MNDADEPVAADQLASFVARFRAAVSYDPGTGKFVNLKQRRRSKVGAVIGTAGRHDGYVKICFERKTYLAHRLAVLHVTGEWPADDVDHCDLDRANNRWSNLRPATQSQNSANAAISRRNTSGFKGVSFEKRSGRWQAYIGVRGRQLNLGYFASAPEAHAAYVEAAGQHFGKFARAG